MPLGVVTSMISPFFLPMRAAPMGLLKLILPLSASASSVAVRVERDDFGAGNLVLQPGHLDIVDGRKAFLRGVVFGVFAQIALCTGINQFLQYARTFHIF